MIVLRPSSRFLPSIRWKELWEHRELLYFLVWRDVKVRYRQAALGVLWAILQPALSTLVLAFVFGKLARMDTGGIPYPVFVCSGLLLWTYFSNALTAAAGSLVGNAHLITKVYFPRVMVPAAVTFAGLLDLAVAFPVVLVLMAWYGVRPPADAASWLALLVLPVLTLLLALGVGLLLSALNVRYRDVRHAVPFLMQIWMFATPIVYPLDLAPPALRFVIALNPMAGLVEGFRASLLGQRVPLDLLGIGLLATATLLCAGLVYFHRAERALADVV